MSAATRDVETPQGRAVVHLHLAAEPTGALVLGHGAGGGVEAPRPRGRDARRDRPGVSVVLVEQPYRVAGRRSPPRAPPLDAAWTAVLDELRGGARRAPAVVTGGRSSGARVACRTAAATGAAGVLCLAFPLRPPRRAGGAPRRPARTSSTPSSVPVLVVQGERDRFGMPPAGRAPPRGAGRRRPRLRSDREAVTRRSTSGCARSLAPGDAVG